MKRGESLFFHPSIGYSTSQWVICRTLALSGNLQIAPMSASHQPWLGMYILADWLGDNWRQAYTTTGLFFVFGAHTNMIPHLSEQGLLLQSLSDHQPPSLTVSVLSLILCLWSVT